MKKHKTQKTAKVVRMVLYVLLALWIGVVFSFSLRPGTVSHEESDTVKSHAKQALTKDGIGVNRSLYDIYRPFVENPAKINGEDFVRKTAHLTEYFILGTCCVLLFVLERRRAGRRAWLLFGVGPAVALIDEKVIQKYLVVGRTSSLKDAALDSIGFFLAFAVGLALALLRRRVLKRRAAKAGG